MLASLKIGIVVGSVNITKTTQRTPYDKANRTIHVYHGSFCFNIGRLISGRLPEIITSLFKVNSNTKVRKNE